MPYKPQIEGLDRVGLTRTQADSRLVKKSGDTMTGLLTITPSSGDIAIRANKDIVLKAGQKLYFDGPY